MLSIYFLWHVIKFVMYPRCIIKDVQCIPPMASKKISFRRPKINYYILQGLSPVSSGLNFSEAPFIDASLRGQGFCRNN